MLIALPRKTETMKQLAVLLALVSLSSCAALQDVEPKDARDALEKAHNACEISKAFTDKTRAATDASREAAEKVLEALPEGSK